MQIVVTGLGIEAARTYYMLLVDRKKKLEDERADLLRTFKYASAPGSFRVAEIGGALTFVNEMVNAIQAVYMKRESDQE